MRRLAGSVQVVAAKVVPFGRACATIGAAMNALSDAGIARLRFVKSAGFSASNASVKVVVVSALAA